MLLKLANAAAVSKYRRGRRIPLQSANAAAVDECSCSQQISLRVKYQPEICRSG
jgi:hypothetical protein